MRFLGEKLIHREANSHNPRGYPISKMRRNSNEKRTKLACDNCRSKKRKCDGVEPFCGRCVKHGLTNCNYSFHLDRRRPFSLTYVESLKEQVQGLEQALTKLRQNEAFEKKVNKGFVSKCMSSGHGHGPSKKEQNHKDIKCPRTEDEYNGSTLKNPININNLIDCYGKFKCENNNIFFYGPRSTVSLIKGQIPLTSSEVRANGSGNNFSESQYKEPNISEHELFRCELYFAFQNVPFYFLRDDLFYEQLNLPAALRNPSLISDGLINAILALGCVFDHNDKDSKVQATSYAARAISALQEEIATPAIPTVQCCGILAIFYISRNQDRLAWFYCGAAISTSYTLGLNMDNNLTSDSVIAEDEAELRRMTFWAVYILERAINNMLGRPTLLKTESIISMVPTGAGISDYSIWSNPNLHRGLRTSEKVYRRSFSLITYTVELLIITSKPLDHIYLSFKTSAPSELQLIVNKANTDLLQFESSLPEFLRLRSILSPQSRNLVSPGPYLFQLRYHNVHILLHRVFFIRDAERFPTDPSVVAHKKICYHSAINISKLISQYDKIFGLKQLDVCAADIICTAAIIFLYLFKNPFAELGKLSELQDIAAINKTCGKKYVKLKDALSGIAHTNNWADKNLHVLKQLEMEWEASCLGA